ncbi:hypothetical protein ACBJ59_04855 [Nonomuraea sp. MTCD27]|uniref:hypothetical protein n=1 Tax=Nonomuraea sp. MTCD27 TaxID=1676747 RepID=UPI0035C1A842
MNADVTVPPQDRDVEFAHASRGLIKAMPPDYTVDSAAPKVPAWSLPLLDLPDRLRA